MFVAPAHELMQGEGDFVGTACAPGNDALELDGIVGDGADFHQLGFNDLRVSHRNSSMALGVEPVEQWWARGDSNAGPLPCQGSPLRHLQAVPLKTKGLFHREVLRKCYGEATR